MRPAPLAALAVLASPSVALAQPDGAGVGEDTRARRTAAAFVGLHDADLAGRSRFHLASFVSFDDGDSTFSKSSRWAYELSAAFRITEGFALTTALPFGLDAPTPGENSFFVGNFRAGAAGGATFHLGEDATNPSSPDLGVGGGLDVYAPTAPDFSDDPAALALRRDPVASVRPLLSYEPELYVSRAMSFRLRASTELRVDVFAADVELALAPGFTVESDSRFFMFFHWLVRLAVLPLPALEPYLELGSTAQIAGTEPAFDLTVPVQLTLGLRGHFVAVDPALFVAIDLKNGSPIFGVDLAGILRPSGRTESRDEMSLDDF